MRRQFKPVPTRPDDFDEFWSSTRQQLHAIDPVIERRAVETAEDPAIDLDIVSFVSLGQVRVAAYLLTWRDHEPRPLVITSHGYGMQCRPRWDWARRGVNVLAVDIRGFGISRSYARLSKPGRPRRGGVSSGRRFLGRPCVLSGRPQDALNQLERLKKQPLDYYQRAWIDARIAAMTPTVLESRRRGLKPGEEDRNRVSFGLHVE